VGGKQANSFGDPICNINLQDTRLLKEIALAALSIRLKPSRYKFSTGAIPVLVVMK